MMEKLAMLILGATVLLLIQAIVGGDRGNDEGGWRRFLDLEKRCKNNSEPCTDTSECCNDLECSCLQPAACSDQTRGKCRPR
nr:conotoxin precursor O2 [Conus ebraeus]UMA82572.1 conotoxin precursor O2 [Conus ebraeus]